MAKRTDARRGVSVSLCASATGTSSNRFFIHCVGRRVLSSALAVDAVAEAVMRCGCKALSRGVCAAKVQHRWAGCLMSGATAVEKDAVGAGVGDLEGHAVTELVIAGEGL